MNTKIIRFGYLCDEEENGTRVPLVKDLIAGVGDLVKSIEEKEGGRERLLDAIKRSSDPGDTLEGIKKLGDCVDELLVIEDGIEFPEELCKYLSHSLALGFIRVKSDMQHEFERLQETPESPEKLMSLMELVHGVQTLKSESNAVFELLKEQGVYQAE